MLPPVVANGARHGEFQVRFRHRLSFGNGEGAQLKVAYAVEVLSCTNIHRHVVVPCAGRLHCVAVVLYRNGAHSDVAVAQRRGGNSLGCPVVVHSGQAVDQHLFCRCDAVDGERAQLKPDGGVEVRSAANIRRYGVLSCIGRPGCVVGVPHRDVAHVGIRHFGRRGGNAMLQPVVADGVRGGEVQVRGRHRRCLSNGQRAQHKSAHGVEVLTCANIHFHGVLAGILGRGWVAVVEHRLNVAHSGVEVVESGGVNAVRSAIVGNAGQGEEQVGCRRRDAVDGERIQRKIDGGVDVRSSANIYRYGVGADIGGLVRQAGVLHRDGTYVAVGVGILRLQAANSMRLPVVADGAGRGVVQMRSHHRCGLTNGDCAQIKVAYVAEVLPSGNAHLYGVGIYVFGQVGATVVGHYVVAARVGAG